MRKLYSSGKDGVADSGGRVEGKGVGVPVKGKH